MKPKYTQQQIDAALSALATMGYACLSDDEKAIVDWFWGPA